MLLRSVLLIFASYIFLYQSISAQLTVDNTQTPDNLVQNVLLGSGVAVFNITFNGLAASPANVQIGSFNGVNSNLGLSSGLMLCSGDVNLGIGPNDESGATLPAGGLGLPGDPDLTQALGGGFTTNDAAVLEFDFIPNGDSLTFRYVFGSEEYLEWVNSSFNDVFGFFISGPGFSGPYSLGAENIAIIPGTGLPVSIDNVNDLVNPAYYVDNGDGFTAPQNTDPTVLQFDGFTTVLEAFALVQCGLTYHIKLAVADAGDNILDSGVFLEAESFSSNASVSAALNVGVGLNDSTLYEGCGTAELIFERYGDFSVADTVELIIGGTSTNGVDYLPALPNGLIFLPGDSVISIFLNAPLDPDGFETLDISILNVAACSGVLLQNDFTFYIDQALPMYITTSDTAILCGQSVEIGPVVFEGFGAYNYTWNTGDITPTINVSPGVTTTYIITVGDTCGMVSQTDSIIVDVPVYPPVAMTVSNDTALVCLGAAQLNVLSITGGNGSYSYEWTENGNVISNSTSINVQAGLTTMYYISAWDACGETVYDSIEVASLPLPSITVDISNDTTVLCLGDPVDLDLISANGGNGVFVYAWTNGVDTLNSTTSLSVLANDTSTYYMVVQDQCGNVGVDSVVVMIPQYDPLELLVLQDTMICYGDAVELWAVASGGAGNYIYDWPQLGVNTAQVQVAPLSQETYAVSITDQCGYSLTNDITVDVEVIIANFTLNYTDDYTITVTNASTPNAVYFLWDFGDGTTDNNEHSGHEYLDVEDHTVTLTVTSAIGCVDITSLEVKPTAHIYVPNSFSPDGDGINDFFGPVGHDIFAFEMRIFNRWGEEIYFTNDIDRPWDGKAKGGSEIAQNGVYVYEFSAVGTRMEVYERRGSVTLIK